MVKLEDVNGDHIYINPSRVVCLSPVEGHEVTRVLLTNDTEDVKGTPDDVHDMLFPEEAPSIADGVAAVAVLERIADAEAGAASLSIHTILLARKALGR